MKNKGNGRKCKGCGKWGHSQENVGLMTQISPIVHPTGSLWKRV